MFVNKDSLDINEINVIKCISSSKNNSAKKNSSQLIKIADNGRGIPIDKHPKFIQEKLLNLDLIITLLQELQN